MITSKKIGVLMGGLSSERDISLKTGTLIAASLKKTGYDVITIDAGTDLPYQIDKNGVEVAFIALHGRYGEDGCVQGLLELMGIPYTGSGVTASAICMDKVLSKRLFEYHSIPTPEYILYKKDEKEEPVVPGYPVVVKPCREGSTIGVSIVSNKEALSPALEKALRYGDDVIIEKYIDGMEVTAGILDNAPLPLIEIAPKEGFYDFKTKTTSGAAEYIVPARLSSSVTGEIKAIALKTHKVMGCCYVSRIDFRIDPAGHPYVLEVNTVPGMTETSLLPRAAGEAGIGYNELVEMILTSAFIQKNIRL
ncbi:MAG: D-alanine--D-alanine ligase [Nitrospirae bacterium RIFCSPLOWO2_02_42_7]|nr:MAG: D-alanine--D-alanine ligase [Nitrospirae bacterium RIFCSPLOWO2_02_42_7]OGW55737.1 MAG: D-alanine--D-alanine ligase [Nitrospirae bacterium RIFCSPHIGHO2_02_FULL_42_12]